MEIQEKNLLEQIKSLQLKNLFKIGTYVDIYVNNCWCQGIIKDIKPKDKYDVLYLFKDNQFKRKTDTSLSSLSILGESTNSKENIIRANCLENDILQSSTKELLDFFQQKIQEMNLDLTANKINEKEENENKDKKENENIVYKGYNLYRFLSGTFIDVLVFINNEVEPNRKNNKSLNNLILLSLDITIFILEQIKSNLSKIKFFISNQKALVFDYIYSIFGSFQIIFCNIQFMFKEDFFSTELISEKKIKIINECYQLILNNESNFNIPLSILVQLISFITLNDSTKKSIVKFQQPKIYQIFLKTIENFSEADLKTLKKISKIKDYSKSIVKGLFNENKENNNRLINECYFTAILVCLKSNILEKKISALNSINDILSDEEDEFDDYFYQFFIAKNKILEIFFEESIHDEIIKRSNDLFKYLAAHDKLENDLINKLLLYQEKKEFYKNILIDVFEKLPSYRKEQLFKNITEKFDFNENEDEIEYLLKIIEACLIENKNNKKKNKTEEEKIKENEEYEKSYKIGLKGIDLLFNFIIKDFDIEKTIKKNNIDKAIDIFNKIKYLKTEDIYNYIEKLFDNIKSDNEHKAVIQSIILIERLLNNLSKVKEKIELNIFEKLDNKYKIFNLIINDLIRYTNIIKEQNITPTPDDIYEGIYSFKENIEQRFIIIFFFARGNTLNKGIKLESKEHLEKIYSILNNKLFNKELINFFSIFSRNINSIPNSTLEEFLLNIIQNEEKFDLASFSNKCILDIIEKVFLKLNKSEGIIYYDTKKFIVKRDNVKKLDLIFDVLVKNQNIDIQNSICNLLKNLCLNLNDYKTSFCQNYWSNFINKIVELFEKAQKEGNIIGLSSLIKLIDIIYSSCINFGGKIPLKNDTHFADEPCEIYSFACPDKNRKNYKIKVGDKDKILLMRWKLGYYYDIQINNLLFEDKDGKRYSFMDDQLIFQEVFPHDIYYTDKDNFISIKVCEEKDLFLKIEKNPKELIENNETLFNILIKNLKSDSLIKEESKEQIWNIILKFKKNLYIDNIRKYGEKQILDEREIKKIFNIKELYIFTYSLECIKEYINKDKNIENEFLYTFINRNKIDEILYKILMNFDTNPSKCQLVHYECLIILVDVIKIIETYKAKTRADNKNLASKYHKEEIFKKFSNIILDLIKIKYDYLYKNNHFNEFDIVDEEDNNYKFKYITDKIDKMIYTLLKDIIKLIEQISGKEENIYMEYLFDNLDLFKNIFIYDYIKCENKNIQQILNEYLSKHLFNIDEEKFIQKYLDIIFSVKVFNELVTNDINGSFFKELSSIMKKYEKKYTDKNDITEINLEQFIKIIDLIINYIQKECENAGFIQIFGKCEKNNVEENISNTTKTEGILKFLKHILKLSPKKLVNYLVNKIDICDLFLIKCILRKSNKNPLNTQKMICDSDKSKETMFDLILFILKHLPKDKKNIEQKIWDILDSKNKLGFWKTNKPSNWRLEPEGISNNYYVGLKNMAATCYMNAIIQQFFMIPKLRETILSIPKVNDDSVLYQLQLLFSALKTYECNFYDPKPFVIKSGLIFDEQMDADEYYGQLIDKIENDIKLLYLEKPEDNPYKILFKFFFGIKVIDELKFVDCGHKRFNEFYYNNIQLEIKGCNNIEDSFKNYCKTEIMDGDNKINCEVCNIKRTCHKRQIFKSLPNILVIALKRFEFDYDTMEKIKLNSYLKFPFELDMKDYLIEDNKETNTLYELTGITIHDGMADFGHYYDFIKAPDNCWYKFDDKNVKKFNEEEIPREAFGDQYSESKREKDEESEEENNAYILIYTKKNFNSEKIENFENNFKTKLALPPYNKMSNINEENKNIINLQMYKFWTLENIITPFYQEFVFNLLKFSLIKDCNFDINLIEKEHVELYKELKEEEEEYLSENKEKVDNTKIFEYGIKYFFNVMLRIAKKKREYIDKFEEIIKLYLESDIKKCVFVLEEFSDNDAINEYLVFCPIEDNIRYVSNIIITSFKTYFFDKNTKEKDFLFKYINSLLIFIYYNIDNICLEHVLNLFSQLINIGKKKIIIHYLKEKNIEQWIYSLDKEELTEEDETNNDIIMSDANLPVIKSNHFILTQKETFEIENKTNKENDRNSEVNKANEKRLKNTNINFELMRRIGYDLNI